MQSKEFFEALKALEVEKNINEQAFIDALESGLTAAFKKIYGEAKKAKVQLNPEKKTIKIFSYKTVVENVEDPEKEISLADAKKIKKSYAVGDEILQEENSKDFGRVPSSTVKHVILQKLREVSRANERIELSSKQNQIIALKLMRYDSTFNNYCFNMGGMEVECLLNDSEIIPGERFKKDSVVKLFVKSIKDSPRCLQLIVSRKHPVFVQRLLEEEIPELINHSIKVVRVAREAGVRSKVAVDNLGSDIDVVGSCIGHKGTRIMPIVKELKGEKIDIIPYNEDIKIYIANALSPAKVKFVEILDEEEKQARVVVADDELATAIGKAGLNIVLASKLTGWHLDIKSETQYANLGKEDNSDLNENLEEQNAQSESNDNAIYEDDDDLFGDIEE